MERPPECSECTRECEIEFIQIDNEKQVWNICNSCHILKNSSDENTCPTCGTEQRSGKMGCMQCYSHFKPSLPKHCGRSPKCALDQASFDKLSALDKELQEALKLEKYEEAAYLRDQIRDLKGKHD